MAGEDVLGDRKLPHQRTLLVDDGDAQSAGFVLIDATQQVAVEPDLTGIRRVHAADDLAQRRLARAVLAQQSMNLTAANIHGHVTECLYAGELLPARAHLQPNITCIAHGRPKRPFRRHDRSAISWPRSAPILVGSSPADAAARSLARWAPLAPPVGVGVSVGVRVS